MRTCGCSLIAAAVVLWTGSFALQLQAQPLAAPSVEEIMVLLRVIPTDATVELHQGKLQSGTWKPHAVMGRYQVKADNGIAVFKLPKNKQFGIYQLTLQGGLAEGPIEFRSCNGIQALVFDTFAKEGDNYGYVADVLTQVNGSRLSVQYAKDVNDVNAHPEETRIASGNLWRDHPYELVPSLQPCVDKVPEAVKTSVRVRKNR